MRNEISAGIKNALERGYSLEEAIQSFINAGYNPVEVKESANSLTSGATSILNTQPVYANSSASTAPNASQIPQMNTIKPATGLIYAPKDIPKNIDLSAAGAQMGNQGMQTAQNPPIQINPYLPPKIQENRVSKKKVILLICLLAFLIMSLLLFIIYQEQILNVLKK